RLTELRSEEQELTQILERQRDGLKKQIRNAWMQGDTPAVKVLLNEISPEKVARTMTYYEYLSKDTVGRLETFHKNLDELRTTQAAVKNTQAELAATEDTISKRQQALKATRQER